MNELPIIQRTYDLIRWYLPILNRLPRHHRFFLGDRMISGLYDLLDKVNWVDRLNSRENRWLRHKAVR